MRLVIEIAAAALFVVCISATSAAFAAGKIRPQRRRPELRVQRSAERVAAPLRRDQAAMRRKILCELLRGQAAVGDVRKCLRSPRHYCRPGERRDHATVECAARVGS